VSNPIYPRVNDNQNFTAVCESLFFFWPRGYCIHILQYTSCRCAREGPLRRYEQSSGRLWPSAQFVVRPGLPAGSSSWRTPACRRRGKRRQKRQARKCSCSVLAACTASCTCHGERYLRPTGATPAGKARLTKHRYHSLTVTLWSVPVCDILVLQDT
jgi:hypothetical protein